MPIRAVLRSCVFVLLLPFPSGAAQEGRVELVMFEQALCDWCERWDEEIGGIYARTAEGKAAPLRRVDIHADRPEDLEDVRGIAFTPTFVLVEDGEEIGRIAGYPGEDFFWPMLEKLMEKSAAVRP